MFLNEGATPLGHKLIPFPLRLSLDLSAHKFSAALESNLRSGRGQRRQQRRFLPPQSVYVLISGFRRRKILQGQSLAGRISGTGLAFGREFSQCSWNCGPIGAACSPEEWGRGSRSFYPGAQNDHSAQGYGCPSTLLKLQGQG